MPDDRSESAERSLACAVRFVGTLAEMPYAEWIEIGHRAATHGPERDACAASALLVDAVIADQRLGFAAWLLSDTIDTAAFLALHEPGAPSRPPPRDRRRFAAARSAAERAARAILVAEHLDTGEIAALTTDFERAPAA